MRKFIIAIVLFLGFIFVVAKLTEIQTIAETLQGGNWWYLGLALIVELVWVINCGASFRSIYRGMGIEEQIGTLSLIVLAANFVNIIAPSVGVGGLAIFMSEARRRNYSPARAAVAGVLFLLFDYLGLIGILLVGLIILIRRNDLTLVVILASAALVALAMLFAFLLNLGMQSAVALGNALDKIAHFINRILRPFIHREYLSEVRAHEFAHDAAEGLIKMRGDPRTMLMPLLLALTNKTFLIIILTLVFLAFKIPISIGTIIACFSIGYLFVIISPTPAGIGVVEGALTLALTSMYISLEDAAVITLSYRGITFWIPLLFGMISLRVLEKVGIKPNINNNIENNNRK
jgi:glycosyltransferase 2 family protein